MAKIYRDIDDPIELEVLKENAQLGNVPNVTTNNQTPTWSMATTLANIVSGETLTKIMGKISKAINDIISHIGNKSNPHGVTKSQVGLGNVGNYKAVSTVASQGLTTTEQSNARANIGAGTSNFSGSYNDLTNKPTLPTVNNATLTIQKNGTDIGTFTANASANKDINITVPTKTSELTNDSGYKTTDNNTTYTLTKSGSTISLTGSDGSKTSVTDSNTTYTLSSFGVTATAAELNKLDGCTATVTELNYLDGVTSNIQTQLNGKLSTSGTASSATKLATARKIAGTSFDGTKDISISYNNLTDKPTIPSGVQVIDNLTSSSTTASLSANQGRILKGYIDKKVVVSSTQPSGQQTGDTWYQII